MGLKSLVRRGTEDEEYQLNSKLQNMKELLAMERVKMHGVMAKAVWRSELKKAEVTEKLGGFWDVMGHSENSKLYLHPEEALYLLDVAALEITYRQVPLSLQRAYVLLLNETGVSCNHYRVYSHLSLLGYNVQRHSKKNILTKYEKDIEVHKIGIKLKDCPEERIVIKKSKCTEELTSRPTTQNYIKTSSTLSIGVICSDEETLSRLRVISPVKLSDQEVDVENLIDYDVYLEKGSFRKSELQLPDYRICIVSMSDPIPDIFTTLKLNRNYEDEVPVVYAIVHPDFIQFMQVAPVTLPTLL